MNNFEKDSYILYKLSLGYALTQCLYIVSKLNIADLLSENSLTIDELSSISKANKDNLKRVMDFLVGEGIFDFKDNKYSINNLSKALTENSEYSIKNSISEIGNPFHWSLWMTLYDSVLSGKSGFEILNGITFEKYLEKNDEVYLEIVKNNTANTVNLIPDILKSYDFSNYKKITEIGGGQGILLASILRVYKNAKGILIDKKEVINNAIYIKEKGLAERILTVANDIYEPIVDKSDLYILKSIISNNSNENCIKILNNCYKSMDGNSKLLIIDSILPDNLENTYLNYMNINLMLIDEKTKNRNINEYKKLLEISKLKLNKIIKLNENFSMLEIIK
jgi:hypothetical protein